MFITQRRLETEVEFFTLDDCVLSYNPLSRRWHGRWRDGADMNEGTALSIALVERLAWPDGEAKQR